MLSFVYAPEAGFLRKDFSPYGATIPYRHDIFKRGESAFLFEQKLQSPLYCITAPVKPSHWIFLFTLLQTLSKKSTVYVLMPCMACLRSFDPCSLIFSAGAKGLMTCDPHVPLVHENAIVLSAYDIWIPFLTHHIKEDDCLVFPDKGSFLRARPLTDVLKCFYAEIHKTRHKNIVSGKLSADVFGKKCWIVDDIVDTGKTLALAIECLKKQGAKTISCVLSHILPSSHLLPFLNKTFLNGIFCLKTQPSFLPFAHCVPIAPLMISKIPLFKKRSPIDKDP